MKIEKCPFCGSEAETFEASEDSFSILCTGCGVETPYLPYLTEAIAAWNRRVEPKRGFGNMKRRDAERSRAMNAKPILDACCGARMFWFDKNNPNVEFCDNRVVPFHEYYSGRYIEIKPDTVCDFTALPFPDKTFKLVVFDPPHLGWAGPKSWIALKYGRLDENWPQMIHDGFWECMRVLDDYGTLIFKWSEVQFPLRDVIKAIGTEPLFGHRSGKHNNTHWMAFMKIPEMEEGEAE